jgi:transcriptional regulator with XRE-family HTH domain
MARTKEASRQREELGHFLRTRRSRVSPADLGLIVSAGKRRTPGLRREEVAVLAGIGTSWYTWLEQGRDINVSEPVARAISSALRLSRPETGYLYRLLGISQQPAPTTAEPRPFDTDVAQLVDEWLPNPAVAVDCLWNLLAYNRSAELVFGLSTSDHNLLVSYFTRATLRSRYVDPVGVGKLAVAQFRAGAADHFNDPRFEELVTDLCDLSDEFAALWHDHEVVGLRTKTKEVELPEVGRLSFTTQSWTLDGPDQVRLFLHLPNRMSDTRAKLESLMQVPAVRRRNVHPVRSA